MELEIKFGVGFELKRVKNTLEKSDWYSSQGYSPILPDKTTKESSEDELRNRIIEEFEEKRYEKIANQILSDFSTVKEKLSKKLREVFPKNTPETFTTYLTNYGVGGSYALPNIIIVNINKKKGFKTIVHEIIHLLIENQIQKYKIKHWEKERIVDLILHSKELDFLEHTRWQNNYNHAEEYIDKLFGAHFFKDQDTFFSKIKKARTSIPKSNTGS